MIRVIRLVIPDRGPCPALRCAVTAAAREDPNTAGVDITAV